jgi:hypothetical protein
MHRNLFVATAATAATGSIGIGGVTFLVVVCACGKHESRIVAFIERGT